LASTPTAPQQLKSPFNQEVVTVPPDWTPEFVAELVKRGFEPVPAKKK
jgi:hypothetical protein